MKGLVYFRTEMMFKTEAGLFVVYQLANPELQAGDFKYLISRNCIPG